VVHIASKTTRPPEVEWTGGVTNKWTKPFMGFKILSLLGAPTYKFGSLLVASWLDETNKVSRMINILRTRG
jgi:hypothetical protein